MKFSITQQQYDSMEKDGYDMSQYVIEGEEDTGQMILDSLVELRQRTEKDLETADAANRPRLEKVLKQVKRQERMARNML